MSRTRLALAGSALLAAMVVRVAVVAVSERPAEPMAVNDEAGYHRLAVNLLEGRGFSLARDSPWEPTAIRTPGYPLALAAAYALGGREISSAMALNVLAGSLTAALVVLLALRLGASAVGGFAAGMGWALGSPLVLHYTDLLYADVLAATTVAAAALLAVPAAGPARAVAGGLAWGAAVLVKPFLLPAALAAALAHRPKAAACVVAGIVAAILPWSIRSSLALDRRVILSEGGAGVQVWAGTWNSGGPLQELRRDPSGRLVTAFTAPHSDSAEEAARAEAAWTRFMGALLGEGGPEFARADAELAAIGRERIARDPWRWLGLRARNVALIWTFPEVPGGRPVGALLLVLAIAGAVRSWRGGRRREAASLVLALLATAAVFVPLRAKERYVAPLAPLVFALAGATLQAPRASSRSPGEEP